ncbi:MAG: alpha-1,3-galactosidase B [Bacteroides sp.]|nr:alpha-1,3-galactosidase B [Bacteroides sp.]MCM1413153.1 alpha-1,3-galactosidase B [Bacteroides sp.]MCM1472105.1 alpha-1,3-galactosidase B [Bacteroides sp.]
MKINHLISFLILLMAASVQTSAKVKTVNINNTGRSNATTAINKTIRKASSGLKVTDTLRIVFSPGRYDFHPDKSMERTLFISNHDQTNPKNVGLLIDGINNVVIAGHGAELMFHGRMLPIAIIGSANITISGISIDFDKPHIAQVEILANDTVNHMITYSPAPWVDYVITDSVFSHRGEGWQLTPCAGIAFDPDTRHMVYNTSDIAVGVNRVSETEPGKITAPWNDHRLIPGTIVAMRNYERPAPAIFVDNCQNISLSDIHVHYAEGMGLLAQNTRDITLERFNVDLRGDNDPRYFTTQADATHFSGCTGQIISTLGLYESMMDDAINVHGTYLKIDSLIDSTTVVGRYMHNQSYGFRWGNPGDSVDIIRSYTMENAQSGLTVKSIKPLDQPTEKGAKLFAVTFNQSIDKNIDPTKEKYGLENLTATPTVVFADNTVRNNRARGALFSTPRRVICRDNLFDHTSGCAILLCGDCNGWYETGACHDMTITGNRFVNSLTNLFQFTNAVISIYPEIPGLECQTQYFHSGIKIEGNEFDTFDTPLLYARSVKDLIFMGNRIVRNTDYPVLHWNQRPIWLQHVNEATIQ